MDRTVWASYIHIGHYNSSLMLCALILYVSGETYSLTSTPNDRFLSNFLKSGLFILRTFGRNIFSKKPAHYLLISLYLATSRTLMLICLRNSISVHV